VFLKAAYVEGKLAGDAAVLRMGQSHTPWIDYEQGLWKHRYASQVMTDKYKFDDSFDLGLGLKGKVADGMAQYFVTLTNGTGYANAARANAVDVNARVGFYPVEGLTLDFQFRNGYRGSKTQTNNTGVTVATAGVKSTLFQTMLSYGTSDFRVGGNYVSNKDKANSATASVNHGGSVSSGYVTAAIGDEVKSTAFGLWAWVKFDQFGVFGRFENGKNRMNNVVGDEKLTRFVAGAELFANKNVTLSLVGDNTKLTNRGGVTANQRKDTRFGLYSEIKM